jgi:hypothetical protein
MINHRDGNAPHAAAIGCSQPRRAQRHRVHGGKADNRQKRRGNLARPKPVGARCGRALQAWPRRIVPVDFFR